MILQERKLYMQMNDAISFILVDLRATRFIKYHLIGVLFIFLIFVSNSVLCQVRLGLTGGVNWSRVAGDSHYFHTSYQNGLNFGLTTKTEVNEHLFLSYDLLFVEKGGYISKHIVGTQTTLDLKGIQKVHYIEIPLVINYRSKAANEDQIFIGLGFFVAKGIGGSIDYREEYYFHNNPSVVYLDEKKVGQRFGKTYAPSGSAVEGNYGTYRYWDGGLRASVGYQFGKSMISTSFDLGLVNISAKTTDLRQSDNWKKYSRSVQISLSYFIWELI